MQPLPIMGSMGDGLAIMTVQLHDPSAGIFSTLFMIRKIKDNEFLMKWDSRWNEKLLFSYVSSKLEETHGINVTCR